MPVTDADSAVGIRRRIGFVTEDKELYPYMTVEQIIRFTRPFFPKWRRDLEQRYLEMFELPKARKIPDLSKGMRSKLMLLLAIARGAELLILDEPTDGLDPAATEDVLRELVSVTGSSEITIFFSSHQLSEVELIADHVGIVDHGRMVVSGCLDDMKARTSGFTWSLRAGRNRRYAGRRVLSHSARKAGSSPCSAATTPMQLSSRRNPYRELLWSVFR